MIVTYPDLRQEKYCYPPMGCDYPLTQTGSGIYVTTFKFTMPEQYSFNIIARKQGFDAEPVDLTTAVESTQGGLPTPEIGTNWMFIAPVIGIAVIGVVAYLVRR